MSYYPAKPKNLHHDVVLDDQGRILPWTTYTNITITPT